MVGPKPPEVRFAKTKMCKFNLQGKCAKGAGCSFAHGSTELEYSPDLYRTQMCMALMKSGRCKESEICKYAHTRDQLRAPPHIAPERHDGGKAGQSQQKRAGRPMYNGRNEEQIHGGGSPSHSQAQPPMWMAVPVVGVAVDMAGNILPQSPMAGPVMSPGITFAVPWNGSQGYGAQFSSPAFGAKSPQHSASKAPKPTGKKLDKAQMSCERLSPKMPTPPGPLAHTDHELPQLDLVLEPLDLGSPRLALPEKGESTKETEAATGWPDSSSETTTDIADCDKSAVDDSSNSSSKRSTSKHSALNSPLQPLCFEPGFTVTVKKTFVEVSPTLAPLAAPRMTKSVSPSPWQKRRSAQGSP